MKIEFVQYRVFPTEGDLEDFLHLVKKKNIPYKLEKFASAADSTFLGQAAAKEFILKIPISRVDELNRFLEKEAEEFFPSLSRDYFMFQSSNEELLEILKNPRDWGIENVVYAGKILEERNIGFSLSSIKEEVRQREIEFEKPVKANSALIWMGYLFLPFSYVMGESYAGTLSIFIGFYLFVTKKNNSKGESFPAFDERSRLHGKILIGLGILFWILTNLWYYVLSRYFFN
ncbi:MAG: hypothetical protein AAFY71_16260 [Bacteroidota bacterium]